MKSDFTFHYLCKMNYVELNIPVRSEDEAEIFIALLADLPFESFMQEGATLKCYMPEPAFVQNKEHTDALLAAQGVAGRYIMIEARNWNELWESNFEPVVVDGRCTIRAPFHAPATTPMEIVIMPKMSFGTGHHATTALVTEAMLDHDMSGLSVLDVGSGTGVLAILAAKSGAATVDAVDTDEWAYQNCLENIAENGVTGVVQTYHGDISLVAGRKYDLIAANINLNILLADMPRYVDMLSSGGTLIMSGILDTDLDTLTTAAVRHGLTTGAVHLKDGWAAAEFVQ